ncbi:hypothetical protein OJAV_G00230660 [Oryzias javanicus]|uniref:GPS domain-containing protein n=1 Tax=Oryzias javanicus TaxID=123683 RepID=A0A3S2P9R4_ORYJA|nr:hypothetical protein OJAV_G00230660 [Oryzias javanicus]
MVTDALTPFTDELMTDMDVVSETNPLLRVRMWTRAFIFLIATIYFNQVISGEIYVAELTVESNVTLEASTILSSWTDGSVFQVTSGSTHQVTLESREITAECVVIGDEYNCSCSGGYVWSNEVCYDYECCNNTACLKNVSLVAPLCIPPVNVSLNGTAILSATVKGTETTTIQDLLTKLNGVININVLPPRSSPTINNNIIDFIANASVRFNTTKLQEIVTKLKSDLGAQYTFVDTHGMVTIVAPNNTVDYKSNQSLRCEFDESTDFSGWNLSRPYERFELNTGRQVTLLPCSSANYPSCINVTLYNLTGILAGIYECGFTKGLVRHTASTKLDVALLPDSITMTTDPLIADCSKDGTPSVQVTVNATIPVKGDFEFRWFHNEDSPVSWSKAATELQQKEITIECKKKENTVKISFKNKNQQNVTGSINIPVLTAGDPFCKEEKIDDVVWPKTPLRVTVVTTKCPPGRVGERQRSCGNSSNWLSVLSSCVSEELKKVSNAADNFLQGVGATQEVALNIFEGMRNNSNLGNSTDGIADIRASVNIIDTMAQATKYISLTEDVFPYINSMEVLVKEIQINTSSGFNSTNVELSFCSRDDCNLTIFDIGVNLNKTNGLMKVMAMKNLMDKLENNYENTERTGLILSATLVNNSDSNITISMLFPADKDNNNGPLCVFWNTKLNKWSNEGCIANKTENYTLCECTHLTSFSVLMSKSDISEPALDIITSIGVAVSICCLVLFLIVEWMVWSAVIKTHLSHFRHTAVVNISVFLLLADCSFLASSNPTSISETMCLSLTLCKHLFLLAMFAWMLCLSCSYVYYNYTDTPYHNEKTCWLIYEGLLRGSIYSFILPVGTIVLGNLFSMVVVIVTLVKTSVPDGSKVDEKETAKGILKVVVLLTPVFGLTWGIGFFLLMLDPTSPIYPFLNYSFTIFNAFQGLFIFLVGCLGEQKVREELLRILKVKSGQTDSLSKSTSTAVTKAK